MGHRQLTVGGSLALIGAHFIEADALANATVPSGASVTGTTYATEGVTETIHTAMAAYRWERDSDD